MKQPSSQIKKAHQTEPFARIHNLFPIVLGIMIVFFGFRIYTELDQSSNRLGIFIKSSPKGIIITATDPHGPAARNKVSPGSLIISMDGHYIENESQIDAALKSESPILELTTKNNGTIDHYKIRKGTPPDFSSIFSDSVIGALYLILAYVSIPSRGTVNTLRNTLLTLLFLNLALESILPTISSDFRWIDQTSILFMSILGGSQIFMESYIISITPKPLKWFTQHKKTLTTIMATVGLYLAYVTYITMNSEAEVNSGTQFAANSWSIINLFWAFLIPAILISQYIVNQSKRERKQLVILMAAMFPWSLLLIIYEANDYSGFGSPAWLDSARFLADFFYAIGFLIAIKRYDLADLGHDIQRPFVYRIISGLIVVFFAGELLMQIIQQEHPQASQYLILTLSALALGIMWNPLAKLFRYWSTSPWTNNNSETHTILQNLIHGIMAYDSNDRIAQNIPHMLNSVLHNNWSVIILASGDNKQSFYYDSRQLKSPNWDSINNQMQFTFFSDQLYKPSTEDDQTITLYESGATNILPLIHRNIAFGGIVISQNIHYDKIPNKVYVQFTKQLAEILYNNRMRHQATVDGLTNLFRREAILEKLHNELIRYQRTAEPIALGILDIDHFKLVNDRYGHHSGDLVLRHAADIFKSRLRSADYVGRFGGEEFLFILPKTSAGEARTLLDAIRRNIETSEIDIGDGNSISITASIGISCTESLTNLKDQSVPNFRKELIERADQALYIAKKKGRNQIVIAPSF